MGNIERSTADQIEAALRDVDVFAPDTPNLNAWPQPNVRREFSEWLAARIDRGAVGVEYHCQHGRPVPATYELPCGCGGTVTYVPAARAKALEAALREAVGIASGGRNPDSVLNRKADEWRAILGGQ